MERKYVQQLDTIIMINKAGGCNILYPRVSGYLVWTTIMEGDMPGCIN